MEMSELIVKGNALIEASYTLGLAEQRLILLAIIEARETGQGIDSNSLLRVHAHAYAEQFDIDKNNSYEVIKDASKGLFDRYVTYHDKNPKNGNDRSFHCRWVDKIGYEKANGTVYMRFTSDVVPLITRLEEQFTSYEIDQVATLDSSYAIRLYELVIKWRSVGKTPMFELQKFRQQIGVEDAQYKTMSNFKSRVLDPAISQINEHTDINVAYEQEKEGRSIVGFSFKFKAKPKSKKSVESKRDKDTPDMFTSLKMTDNQRGSFAAKLSKMSELSGRAKQREDYKQFAERIESELLDKDKQIFYIPYLKKLGFKV